MNTPKQIIANTCKKYGLEKDRVLSKSRSQYIVLCRTEIIKELRTLGLSFLEIGRFLGRDHSSIMNLFYGWKKNGKSFRDITFMLRSLI